VIPNLSTYVKELSGYNIRIGYPRQKFSYVGCPEINETSAVASVGMIMAAKDNKYLNCLSEPPAHYEEEEEAAAASAEEEVDVDGPAWPEELVEETVQDQDVPQPDDAKPEEAKETERRSLFGRKRDAEREKKEKEPKEPKKPKIVWKNPFDAFTKKVGSAVGRIIDDGYDGMEE
jgi:hypothetical protein